MNQYTDKARLDRLVRECDRLWRRAIMVRAGGHCEMCGAPTPADLAAGGLIIIDACHIIGRSDWSVRWDPRNGVAGCRRCHCDLQIIAWLGETDPRRYNWVMTHKKAQAQNMSLIRRGDVDIEKVREELQRQAA